HRSGRPHGASALRRQSKVGWQKSSCSLQLRWGDPNVSARAQRECTEVRLQQAHEHALRDCLGGQTRHTVADTLAPPAHTLAGKHEGGTVHDRRDALEDRALERRDRSVPRAVGGDDHRCEVRRLAWVRDGEPSRAVPRVTSDRSRGFLPTHYAEDAAIQFRVEPEIGDRVRALPNLGTTSDSGARLIPTKDAITMIESTWHAQVSNTWCAASDSIRSGDGVRRLGPIFNAHLVVVRSHRRSESRVSYGVSAVRRMRFPRDRSRWLGPVPDAHRTLEALDSGVSHRWRAARRRRR